MKLFRPTAVVLALFCLMYFITYLDRVNVSTAADGFSRDFHLTRTEIGLVFSAFAYPYLLFQIVGGWISDRFGTRRTLIACGLIWSVATILSGMAVGIVSLLGARLILGLGEGATFPAATAAMSRWVAKDKRGFAQGITHAAARIGNTAAPAIIVAVMTTFGWRASFYVCFLISFVWLALWVLLFHENPADDRRITMQELASLPPPRKAISVTPWARLLRRMAPVTIVYFCYGWTLWLYLSWIPQYFLHSYGLNLTRSAIFASAVFFAGTLGDSMGGLFTDVILRRTGNLVYARSIMIAACMFMTFLALVPLLFMHDLYASLACLSAGFFFSELTIGPMWAVPMDIAPGISGTASGIMNTGSALAAIASPVVAGYVIDRTGNWELPFLGSIVLTLVGGILAFRMRPNERLELERDDAAPSG